MKCPVCDKGMLKKKRIEETMFGVYLGKFTALVCGNCGESFTDEKTTKQIQSKAKEEGIWGMGKQTKIIKTGNSFAVRIPKKIADYLNLKQGVKAFIHPEGKKIVIEV